MEVEIQVSMKSFKKLSKMKIDEKNKTVEIPT